MVSMAKKSIEPRKADLRKLHPAGTYQNTEDRAASRLARAIHFAESTNVATSWSAQERAQEFYNTHGLSKTLDYAARMEAVSLEEIERELSE